KYVAEDLEVSVNNRNFANDKKRRKAMEDFVLSIPTQDSAFIKTLAARMGWTMRKRRTSVERFINSCPQTPQMTDEEIQAEIDAVRNGQ
ncbi:MAG: hypothetical protein J1E58_08445, partial [Prevotella sp.]|nr:hypothetical protein [Prevotella sp.]